MCGLRGSFMPPDIGQNERLYEYSDNIANFKFPQKLNAKLNKTPFESRMNKRFEGYHRKFWGNLNANTVDFRGKMYYNTIYY